MLCYNRRTSQTNNYRHYVTIYYGAYGIGPALLQAAAHLSAARNLWNLNFRKKGTKC